MPKFILIDQSLNRTGGHHLEYARQVLVAAEAAGFEPHLALNRGFQCTEELPPHWTVRPSYVLTSYSPFRYVAEEDAPRPTSIKQRFVDWWDKRHGRQRQIAAFARDTAALFEDLHLAAGDQVFIPTVSELELLGLGQFLHQFPVQPDVDWHVQFHFPIYMGYEPDYPAQDHKLSRMRRLVRRAAKLAAAHRLHYYTTTDPLCIQFDRLGAACFETLPYPVNPALRQFGKPVERASEAPLRITFLGGVRPEKGYQLLPQIIDRLWTEYVARGRICFHVQSEFEFVMPPAPEEVETVEARAALERLPPSAVTLFLGPLDGETYVRTTKESDIGLLPYDRPRYHARCSGPLVEFLAAGVPVVVPSGCWLADELIEPNREYHLGLCGGPQAMGRTAAGRGTIVSLPPGAAAIALLLRWPEGRDLCSGAYARVETTFFAALGRSLVCRATIIGPARPSDLNTVLLRVPENAASMALDWNNAYGLQRVEFRDVEICFVACEAGRPLPLGAVGLAAAEADDFSTALAEMIDHYPHYRRTAQEFARQWGDWYSPAQVVSELLARAAPAARESSPIAHRTDRAA